MSPPVLETLCRAEGSLVVGWGNVLLQVRHGELSEESFDRLVAALMRHKARTGRGKPRAMIVVTEEGAPIPAESVRVRQRAMILQALEAESDRVATIILGESVEASLLRSASRGVVISHPRLRVVAHPEEACAWLAAELGLDAAELVIVVNTARRQAAAARPALPPPAAPPPPTRPPPARPPTRR